MHHLEQFFKLLSEYPLATIFIVLVANEMINNLYKLVVKISYNRRK